MLQTSLLRWWLTARDDSNSSSLMRGTFKAGVTPPQGLDALAELISLINPLSDAVFVRRAVSITQTVKPRPSPSPGSSVHHIGALFFKADTDNQFFVARIAGFLDTITKSSGCGAGIVIDDTDGRVQDFIAELTGGLWCNPFNHSLETFLSAYIREEP